MGTFNLDHSRGVHVDDLQVFPLLFDQQLLVELLHEIDLLMPVKQMLEIAEDLASLNVQYPQGNVASSVRSGEYQQEDIGADFDLLDPRVYDGIEKLVVGQTPNLVLVLLRRESQDLAVQVVKLHKACSVEWTNGRGQTGPKGQTVQDFFGVVPRMLCGNLACLRAFPYQAIEEIRTRRERSQRLFPFFVRIANACSDTGARKSCLLERRKP